MSDLTHEERLLLLRDILEDVEDFLEAKGIDVPNHEKEQDEFASLIYGTDYGDLTGRFEQTLINWKLIDKEK